jgi:hypothetical protein
MRKFIPLFVVFAFVVACAPTSPAPTDANAPTPTVTPLPIAYQDNFDSTGSGWYAGVFDAGEHSYSNGGYRVFVSNVDWYSWAVNPSAKVYGDIRVEVDAQKLSGPDSGEYGVLCRVDYEASSFYAGVVTSEGAYAIYKSINEGPIELIDMAAMGFSEAVTQGGTTNHIRLDCIGDTLTLYANGTQLVQVTDDTLPTGEAGVYSGTFDPGGTEILFDNFVVYQP